MTLYVILVFIAILVGMAISVSAFGTGGKRKKIFQDIYFSVEDYSGTGVIYTKTGEYSAVLRMENPIFRYSADTDQYYEYVRLFKAITDTLGDGYAIHKQDIFTKRKYEAPADAEHDFLSDSYFEYFRGRTYTDCETYLTIVQESKKGRFMTYDAKSWREFLTKIEKVKDQLLAASVSASFLNKGQASDFVDRFFAMNFSDRHYSMNNITVDDEALHFGSRTCKIYSLVDVDTVSLPALIRPYSDIEVNGICMPVDLLSVIENIPSADTVVYNQMIFMPNQKHELAVLDKKKNRHSSMPSPANLMAVEDIKNVQDVIARENKRLVFMHFNLMVCVAEGEPADKCTNYLENVFGRLNISISKHAYNQLELFVNSFPGNCYSTSEEYDRFLTLSDAAISLMYKENIQRSEVTPLKIYYTDRQGIPVAIDISGKEGEVKMTNNSNFFCLGPSGSGKSFNMNSVVRQMWFQGTDIVMVDTGHSYSGLCNFAKGKYISYTEEAPITMNPFRIRRDELNIEKVGFLKNLVLIIWKGVNGEVSEVENRLIEQVITEYYDMFFEGFAGFTPPQREDLRLSLIIDEKSKPVMTMESDEELDARIEKMIDEIERRRMGLQVQELSFNSFYEFSVPRLPDICRENQLRDIELSTYRYMMKDFYRGGNHEKTLNEDLDSSLFDQTFIVFEIDSIKDDPKLFPIVTLIIMDVFLQKMRMKKNRKMLVIEEAWKAIASPLMAEYIQYLYKTARKFWASVGVVTQEVQDIIGSPVVKEAIINNSDVMMLLDQTKFRERFDDIRAILGLTEIDCRKIFTINELDNKDGRSFFREVFIRRGNVSGVYGVEESRECYLTYTTERIEKDAINLYEKELGCGFEDAIRAFIRDWDLSGEKRALDVARLVKEKGHVLNLKPEK